MQMLKTTRSRWTWREKSGWRELPKEITEMEYCPREYHAGIKSIILHYEYAAEKDRKCMLEEIECMQDGHPGWKPQRGGDDWEDAEWYNLPGEQEHWDSRVYISYECLCQKEIEDYLLWNWVNPDGRELTEEEEEAWLYWTYEAYYGIEE